VCKKVSPPRVPAPEIRPLSLEEAKRFLAAAEGDRLEAVYVLGLTSGARRGELTGLFWSDLKLDHRVMQVQRSLIKGKGGYSFDTPKTKGSRSSVRLARRAVEALARHQERQRAAKHPVEGDTLVFTNTAAARSIIRTSGATISSPYSSVLDYPTSRGPPRPAIPAPASCSWKASTRRA
jgi:integrase